MQCRLSLCKYRPIDFVIGDRICQRLMMIIIERVPTPHCRDRYFVIVKSFSDSKVSQSCLETYRNVSTDSDRKSRILGLSHPSSPPAPAALYCKVQIHQCALPVIIGLQTLRLSLPSLIFSSEANVVARAELTYFAHIKNVKVTWVEKSGANVASALTHLLAKNGQAF